MPLWVKNRSKTAMARFETKFISQTLLRSVEMTVIIPSPTIPESLGVADRPASYEVKDPYPVLYLLHGLGNDHSDWTSYTNVELFAEEQSMAVVMISAENKFYRKNADGDDFFHFLSEEVPAFIKGMFPVSNRPEDTYIAGLSMGGYGAMIHGLNHPERFAAIGAFSAAIGTEDEQEKNKLQDGPFDPYGLIRKNVAEGKKIPPIYFSCGMQDMLWEKVCHYEKFMEENGVDVTWVPVDGFRHEWRFWNLQIEKFLEWIPRTDAYAADQKQHRSV